MNPRVLFVCILLSVIPGCATSAFQSTWFLERSSNQNQSQDDIYIMLTNRSDMTQHITRMTINQGDGDENPMWSRPQKFLLVPGGVWVGKTKEFCTPQCGPKDPFLEKCLLPVRIKVYTEKDEAGVLAEMSGRLPSALPKDWGKNCPGTASK